MLIVKYSGICGWNENYAHMLSIYIYSTIIIICQSNLGKHVSQCVTCIVLTWYLYLEPKVQQDQSEEPKDGFISPEVGGEATSHSIVRLINIREN